MRILYLNARGNHGIDGFRRFFLPGIFHAEWTFFLSVQFPLVLKQVYDIARPPPKLPLIKMLTGIEYKPYHLEVRKMKLKEERLSQGQVDIIAVP